VVVQPKSSNMKEARYFYAPDVAVKGELSEDEAKHATRVLRLREGDEIFLIDGKGTFFRAEVTLTSPSRCMYEIRERITAEREWHGRIHLAIAPTKMSDRMEWLAEKATEVGFDELTLLDCKFSERRTLRKDRLDRIVLAAVKQSRKAWLPVVNEMTAFETFVQQPLAGRKYIAHCYDEIERKDFFESITQFSLHSDITVMVGPEGDFSIDEVRLALDNGFESVTLGSSRLRTETAGLAAVMMSQLSLRKQ